MNERVLRSNARILVKAVAHFIPDNPDGDCVTLYKSKPPDAEPELVSLRHSELQEFVDYVTEFIELRTAEPGKHLLISLGEGGLGAVGSRPQAAAEALVRAIEDDRVRDFIHEVPIDRALVEAINARSRQREVELAIEELESHLAGDEHVEQTYQDWLKRHGWAFGMSYLPADDVRTIAKSDHVDFLLPVTMTEHRDVAELKRPDRSVLGYDQGRRSYHFSAEASKGIGQCHRYLEKLQEQHRTGLDDEPEIIVSYPRAILVIGRSNDWSEPARRALDGLNSRLHGIQVVTYDHLLAQAKRFLALLRGGEPAPVEPVAIDDPFSAATGSHKVAAPPPPPDDDVPF